MQQLRIRILLPEEAYSLDEKKRISKLEQEVQKQIYSGRTEILISEPDPKIRMAVFQTYRANGYQPQKIKDMIPHGVIYKFQKEAEQ